MMHTTEVVGYANYKVGGHKGGCCMKRQIFISGMMMLFTVTVVKRVEMMRNYEKKDLATEINVACADTSGCTCIKTQINCPCVAAMRQGKSSVCNPKLCTNTKCPCGKNLSAY